MFNRSAFLRATLQYIVIILVTAILVWFSLQAVEVEQGNKWDYLLEKWQQADKTWLMAMAAILLISHVLRALRWQMLFEASDLRASFTSSFISLLIGYWVNTFLPRGGEVSRCYNLYKLDNVPIDVSVGTVLIERLVDLVCLFLIVALAFVLESERLLDFLTNLPLDYSRIHIPILIGFGGLLLIALVIFLLLRNGRIKRFLSRTWSGVREGLTSIFRLKHRWVFFGYSVSIWFLYYLMTYIVFKAFTSTAHLSFGSVLNLFGLGSIAMAAPLPAGTGSYHVLVPEGLQIFYGIPKSEGVGFTFIYHGWQTFITILFGAISLVVTTFRIKKAK